MSEEGRNVILKPEQLEVCFMSITHLQIHIEALYPFWILLLGAHRLVYHIYSVDIYTYRTNCTDITFYSNKSLFTNRKLIIYKLTWKTS